jgi:hypothetical protein
MTTKRKSTSIVLDDVECGAVLDRATGVQELGFAADRAPGHLRGAAQLDQGGVADRAYKAVTDIHASGPQINTVKCDNNTI